MHSLHERVLTTAKAAVLPFRHAHGTSKDGQKGRTARKTGEACNDFRRTAVHVLKSPAPESDDFETIRRKQRPKSLSAEKACPTESKRKADAETSAFLLCAQAPKVLRQLRSMLSDRSSSASFPGCLQATLSASPLLEAVAQARSARRNNAVPRCRAIPRQSARLPCAPRPPTERLFP